MRKLSLRACLLLAGLSASCVNLADEPLPSTVADLRYGVTLYEYYQSNYFGALSELMVAEARGGIQGHSDNPELIAGSIGLAFGMEARAGDTFTRLLDASRPQAVRDTAWYYLGKLQYQQGDWAGARQSFDQVSSEIDQRLTHELAVMRLQILLRNDDYKEARALYEAAENPEQWGELANYNLGVALGREGDAVAAQSYLDKVVTTPLRINPEQQKIQRALRDRAYTASGYVHIQQGEYDQAVAQFQKVRLSGPYSDRALLGLGWAFASKQDWQSALSPWQKLANGSLQQASVLESLMAVPWAYEQLGADVDALAAYEGAEQVFMGELQKVESIRQQLSQQFLLNSIRQSETRGNQSWFALDQDQALQPEVAFLGEVFARNDFQTRVQAIRDLLFLQTTLVDWQKKLAIYADLLVQRGQVRTDKLARMNEQGKMQQEVALREEKSRLAAWLFSVEKNQDYLALLTDEDAIDNLETVDEALANIAELNQDDDYEEELRQLNFYRGILLWNAQESFSANLWEQKRSMQLLDKELENLTTIQTSLQKAIDDAPEILPYQQRMGALDQRIATESVALEQQLASEEAALRGQLDQALNAHKVRVKNYLARARLSIARLYDERLKQ